MKKLVLLALLAITHTTALAAGMGTNLNGDNTTLMFPVRTGSIILEPFLSYSKLDGDTVDSVTSNTFGIGIFSPSELTDDISFYWGFKIAIGMTEIEDFGLFGPETIEIDETIIAPTLGAEYFMTPRVSLAVEHSINIISSETSLEDSDSESADDDVTVSENSAILRIYFN
jgi:hypothetical protein